MYTVREIIMVLLLLRCMIHIKKADFFDRVSLFYWFGGRIQKFCP